MKIDFEKYLITTRSGARIALHPDCPYVIKYGPQERQQVIDRIVAQGRFMANIGTTIFPDVHLVFEYGYLMEQLDEIPGKLAPENAVVLLSKAQRLLSTYLWGQKKKVLGARVLGKEHMLYVLERAHGFLMPDDVRRIQAAMDRVRTLKITEVNYVHGDPTIDNLMYRSGTSTVLLTDPIPASEKMPAVAAHDLGKLLQSAYGYEQTLIGNPLTPGNVEHLSKLVLAGWDDDDRYAANYFLAVHVLRLLPYQPVLMRPIFANWLNHIPL